MRIQLTVARAGYDAGRAFNQEAGSVIEVPDAEAKRMIDRGQATPYAMNSVMETTMVEQEKVHDRQPVGEQPVKRGRGRPRKSAGSNNPPKPAS